MIELLILLLIISFFAPLAWSGPYGYSPIGLMLLVLILYLLLGGH